MWQRQLRNHPGPEARGRSIAESRCFRVMLRSMFARRGGAGALATPVNIYDPMLSTNFANDISQNSLSLGDFTYGQRLGNST